MKNPGYERSQFRIATFQQPVLFRRRKALRRLIQLFQLAPAFGRHGKSLYPSSETTQLLLEWADGDEAALQALTPRLPGTSRYGRRLRPARARTAYVAAHRAGARGLPETGRCPQGGLERQTAFLRRILVDAAAVCSGADGFLP